MKTKELKERLRGYSKSDVIFSKHAKIRAIQRKIDFNEIIENIINPDKLIFAFRQKARKNNEEKYVCYFILSNTLCHRYALIINKRIIICTAMKINRRWQRRTEKHAKV